MVQKSYEYSLPCPLPRQWSRRQRTHQNLLPILPIIDSKSLQIVPLPNAIISWLIALLQKLPVNQLWSKLGHGNVGDSTTISSERMTFSSNPSTKPRYGARIGRSLSNTTNLILGLFLYHFLRTMTLTDESQVARPYKKHTRPCKHHHHGGRAACPSSGVDLMNPHHQRGGRPCAYHFAGCCWSV